MNLSTVTINAEKALLSLLITIHDDKREGWNLAKITTSCLLPFSTDEFVQKISLSLNNAVLAKIFFMHDEIWVAWQGNTKSIFMRLQSSVFFFFLKPEFESFPQEAVIYVQPLLNMTKMCAHLRTKLMQKPAAATVPAFSLHTYEAGTADDVLSYTQAQAEEFHTACQQREERARPHILIVEDQLFARKILFEMLKNIYTVDVMSNAHDGLASYLDKAHDIVFLDIELGQASGHALARTIKQLDRYAFVVMVTGHASKGHKHLADENHVSDFIPKPYTKDKIFQCIAHFDARAGRTKAMVDSA
jgi:CheY-like chemotaxis protein